MRGIGNHGKRFAGEKAPVQIDHGDGGLRGANIADQHGQIVVQAQQRGPAPARTPCDSTFGDPAFGEQVFNDERNRAALQAGMARQVRTRNGLARANQLQHYIAIDVPRNFARCKLRIGQVDAAYASLHSRALCQRQIAG